MSPPGCQLSLGGSRSVAENHLRGLAFEPSTLALGIFVGQKLCATCLALNLRWPKPRHVGKCLRRNRHTLLDTLADELAEPVMYYLNHLPPSAWALGMLVVFMILL
jgi:hypothetical protein